MDEERILSELEEIVDEIRRFRGKGKKAIEYLALHIKDKHESYLKIEKQEDLQDLQMTLQFFGIRVLVKAEIPLRSPLGKEEIIGKLTAYRLPEGKEDEQEPLALSYDFDESGNIKENLNIHTFPIYFVKELVDKLIAKKIPIS
jgi:hypothetical protein